MRPFVPAALVLSCAAAANAQVTLNAAMTVDNAFTAYISTDPVADGASFLSGNSWGTTFTGSTVLSDAGTYYLHVAAVDHAAPAMFIGQLSLDSTDATFANGTQSLLTGTTEWTVSDTAFGGANVTPTDLGPNGTSPWGTRLEIDSTARYLWHPSGSATAYFTTVITVVPAPAAFVSFASLGLLAMRRRR